MRPKNPLTKLLNSLKKLPHQLTGEEKLSLELKTKDNVVHVGLSLLSDP